MFVTGSTLASFRKRIKRGAVPTTGIRQVRGLGRIRRGIATVEVAVFLPILILLILGTVEVCHVVFLKQSLAVAAYEGARVAIVPGSKSENVIAQIDDILAQRNVTYKSINIEPNDFDNQPPSTLVTVTVEASVKENGQFVSYLFPNSDVQGSATMMLEY